MKLMLAQFVSIITTSQELNLQKAEMRLFLLFTKILCLKLLRPLQTPSGERPN